MATTAEIIDWINANSATVQAVSTVVLVMVTAYYAWQTRTTNRRMAQANKLSVMPAIVMEKEFVGANQPNPWSAIIKNIGNGPAVNLKIEVSNPTYTLEISKTVLPAGQTCSYKIIKGWDSPNPYPKFWCSNPVLTIQYNSLSDPKIKLMTKIKLSAGAETEIIETSWR